MKISLYDHAVRLHLQSPDVPLPKDGRPYPDDQSPCRHRAPFDDDDDDDDDDRDDGGERVAALLDAHFARSGSSPGDLDDAFTDLDVPFTHRDPSIEAAASRVDPALVQKTGRWLVRHGTDRCSVTVGLALLATGGDEADNELIRTVGLLSNRFGALAAEALQRRPGGEAALLWLARRVSGWGRVYVVEALYRTVTAAACHWLLRHACDGDFLNAYFAGRLAVAAHLDEAIMGDADDELVDHTGQLLCTMMSAEGLSMTLDTYPHAVTVLAAHAEHLGFQEPEAGRYRTAAVLAAYLTRNECGTPEQRDRIVERYRSVLDRPDWCAAIHADGEHEPGAEPWFVENVAMPLRLRAFDDFPRGARAVDG